MTTRPLDHRRPSPGNRRASTGSGAFEVARAPAGGTPQRVGGFRFYFADDRWEWSEPVQPMHGYEPGTVAPTTELVVSHKHPEDYDQIAATIEEIRRTGKPFSTRHRIIDAKGNPHDVVVVATQLRDDHGFVIGTEGFYMDVTPASGSSEVVTALETWVRRGLREYAVALRKLAYSLPNGAGERELLQLSEQMNTAASQDLGAIFASVGLKDPLACG